jgi:hypothetical protein
MIVKKVVPKPDGVIILSERRIHTFVYNELHVAFYDTNECYSFLFKRFDPQFLLDMAKTVDTARRFLNVIRHRMKQYDVCDASKIIDIAVAKVRGS